MVRHATEILFSKVNASLKLLNGCRRSIGRSELKTDLQRALVTGGGKNIYKIRKVGRYYY
jgi:hypothetical protein